MDECLQWSPQKLPWSCCIWLKVQARCGPETQETAVTASIAQTYSPRDASNCQLAVCVHEGIKFYLPYIQINIYIDNYQWSPFPLCVNLRRTQIIVFVRVIPVISAAKTKNNVITERTFLLCNIGKSNIIIQFVNVMLGCIFLEREIGSCVACKVS